ncbi:ferrous iron transport protein B [Kordiimonas aquimaris]|uniref:ferrous iron transport protein B n=1 Tax=Kordiimonas aquimaris TaxID=707591 RepID=UPI0021D1A5B4|nr:ferrous iron transport protein B [Kordiimonas aquimaris]
MSEQMSETNAPLIAVVGNPNCGKSALFNALTGLRQKVANYPGATVERRVGKIDNTNLTLIDLPGSYGLEPRSADEEVTCQVIKGKHATEQKPAVILSVVDATNLAQHLRFSLELRSLGLPIVIALNMTDLAAREKIKIDADALSKKLGVPVIETVAVRKKGLDTLVSALTKALDAPAPDQMDIGDSVRQRQKVARKIASDATLSEGIGHKTTRNLDRILLNPIAGPVILFTILFLMFQAVFSWAQAPQDMIEGGIGALQSTLVNTLSDGLLLSFLNDGILSGVGAVIVFLPQILILFLFILVLESTGYMVRAAFIMDRLMASVGLNGRAFIPLLSSFACAVPGIMAARSIANERDRLTTILISPLMTCSARLPVYTVIIAAFIPNNTLTGGIGLQGLVMFALYGIGIIAALIVAAVLKRTVAQGQADTFMLELPKYQAPNVRFVLIGLYERARIFIRRAGTIIFVSTALLWLLAIYPNAPTGSNQPDIAYSFVGIIGGWLEVIFAPIGFNWEISVALVPGMAAREIAIAALGTVYSLSGSEEVIEAGLVSVLNNAWSLPTALSFLAWFIFAPQCLSTIAVTRRETGGWKWPLFMVAYLFALAYAASFITFQVATVLLT